LLFLYNGKIVPLELAGVTSNRYTRGHLFLRRLKKISVSSFEDYKRNLLQNGVILSFADRLTKISQELREHSAILGATLKEDPELLRLMANEVEYPEVLTGRFSEDFLKLPQEILINAMRKHQKYFCALDAEGRILPVFFAVLNTKAHGSDLIRDGHQRVLQARLRDAEFFWHEDLKTSLADRRGQLSRLTYDDRLGSYSEKIERMISIADKMLDQLKRSDLKMKLEKLIAVSKVDLLTHMVGEFPEMQGVMAGLYARNENYPEEEWRALYEQYAPVSADDPVPANLLGALLSLIDRVEVLATGYTLNMIPTGSRDPYALRRIATGAVRILLEHGLKLRMEPLFEHALSLYSIKTKGTPSDLLNGLMELIEARFRFLMEQKDIAVDYLNAVINVEKKSLVAAHGKLMALWSKKGSDDLKTLARGFKRINNIIFDQPKYDFDEELLQEDGEVRLARAFSDLEFRVSQNISEEHYYDALDIMVTLGPEIDNFFDEVLVMADDEKLRNNRIALLQKMSDLYRRIADFSALQI
ncbi:MAG TPA: glycine--tRNA ligase subunit beta, partial [Acidobacteriota bacterium]|nr:glycine--tRNA ligase subunit beta [Acidobacteriota bacterium]